MVGKPWPPGKPGHLAQCGCNQVHDAVAIEVTEADVLGEHLVLAGPGIEGSLRRLEIPVAAIQVDEEIFDSELDEIGEAVPVGIVEGPAFTRKSGAPNARPLRRWSERAALSVADNHTVVVPGHDVGRRAGTVRGLLVRAGFLLG